MLEFLILLLIIAVAVFAGKLYKLSEKIDAMDFRIALLLKKANEPALPKQEFVEKAKAEKTEEKTVKLEPKLEPVVAPAPQFAAQKAEEEIVVRSPKITPVVPPTPAPPVFAPAPKPVNIPTTPKPEKKKFNYEEFIGGNLFGKIGIIILVVGIGFFVKYAIDKNWINEVFRTILGFAVGFALLVTAERLRKTYRTFSSLLAGGAFAIFNVTTAIAFHYYSLFSQPVAFGILVLVAILMSILAILYDRRELAIIALAGGFLAPFLVSTGSGNYLVLFTYISILNLSMFALAMYKKWVELPIISFVFSYLIMLMYTAFSFVPTTAAATHLFIFSTAFFLIFLLPILSILKEKNKSFMNRILLSAVVANSFIYLAFGLYFLRGMGLPFKADGLLTLFIALVNLALILWLRKKNIEHTLLIYTMIGVVLTFVSITVPLQLQGHYITLVWASEMVLLLWLYIRSKIKMYEFGAVIMVVLTAISFLMDIAKWLSLENLGINGQLMFLNGIFITSLFTALALGAFAVLMHRNKEFFMQTKVIDYVPVCHIASAAALGIAYAAVVFEIFRFVDAPLYFSWVKFFSIAYILALILAFARKIDMHKYSFLYVIFGAIAVLFFCFFPESYWKYTFTEETYLSERIPSAMILSWLSAIAVVAVLFFITKFYYKPNDKKKEDWFLVFINIAAVFVWIAVIYKFLNQIDVYDSHKAAFSIALGVAGFVQMILGFRLQQKTLRIISIVSLGIVLAKLILIDLWKMPSIGKIIVFVSLGVILLVLSFLFQKQKLKKEHKKDETPVV